MNMFLILFNMKVCCVFSLELPHRGDWNEFTQYTIFNLKKKIIQNYPKSAAMGFCSKGLKNEFETAVVNAPPVFEQLKFYCIWFMLLLWHLKVNTKGKKRKKRKLRICMKRFLHGLCLSKYDQ